MAHTTKIKVRGYHLDLFKHVNNARYLEFLEEARWAMLEEAADLKQWHTYKFGLSVVNININYKYPATMGDVLEIKSFVERIGNKSVVIKQEVQLADKDVAVADAQVTFVVVNEDTGRSTQIEGRIRQEIEKLAAV